MAHPYKVHAEDKKGHQRVSRILQEAPSDADKHADESSFSRVGSKSAAVAHDQKIPGSKGKYARGGKVIGGDATPENIAKWSERAASNSYARGGALPTAGAMSGVGRLQKAGK